MGQDLATVAKDEKIRLPTTVYAKNRYQDHIWYDESENHPPNLQRQRVGSVPSNWCHEINLTILAFARKLGIEEFRNDFYDRHFLIAKFAAILFQAFAIAAKLVDEDSPCRRNDRQFFAKFATIVGLQSHPFSLCSYIPT